MSERGNCVWLAPRTGSPVSVTNIERPQYNIPYLSYPLPLGKTCPSKTPPRVRVIQTDNNYQHQVRSSKSEIVQLPSVYYQLKYTTTTHMPSNPTPVFLRVTTGTNRLEGDKEHHTRTSRWVATSPPTWLLTVTKWDLRCAQALAWHVFLSLFSYQCIKNNL